MTNIILEKGDKTVRTQITLTKKIKAEIEKHAKRNGESLSEYLRKAARARLEKEKEKKEDLKKLAKRVIGSVKLENHPEWSTKKKVEKWVREIRSEW